MDVDDEVGAIMEVERNVETVLTKSNVVEQIPLCLPVVPVITVVVVGIRIVVVVDEVVVLAAIVIAINSTTVGHVVTVPVPKTQTTNVR